MVRRSEFSTKTRNLALIPVRLGAISASVVAVLAATLIASSSRAQTVLLNDGQSHEISDRTHESDAVYTRDGGCGSVLSPTEACASPGDPTQLELRGGAAVSYLYCLDSSTTTIRGEVRWTARVYGSATLDIDGGYVGYGPEAYDDASVTMSSGTALGVAYLYHFSSLTVTGGYISGVNVNDDSTVILSGGNPNGIDANDRARVEILGNGFELDGAPVSPGPIEASDGFLTGTLASGEGLGISITRDPEATITLVPEAGLTLLHGAAAICLGALARCRCKPRG